MSTSYDASTDTGGTGGADVEYGEPISVGASVQNYIVKLRSGDVGALPALAGLVALVIIFSIAAGSSFTNAFNAANLIQQGAGYAVLAMGLVFVLLLGEIDLSAGYAAGAAASVMGIVMTNQGQPWPLALLATLATGAVIGVLIGLMVARLGVPSFVVTLAAFLGLQGAVLILIGDGGTIPYRDSTVLAIVNSTMPVWLGWALAVATVVALGASSLLKARSRLRSGLAADAMVVWAIKIGAIAVLLFAATAYLSAERSKNPQLASLKGIPVVVAVIGGLLVLLTVLLTRTAWGRHVYAVGGNAEAARRAGINVARIKISCFVLCSVLAAIAGVLLAGRTNSVSPNTGGDLTLLLAVGSAVIGGTSLFGGKGKVMDAILGALVVTMILNGMTLLGQPAGRVFIITGLVLLVAASVDAVSRKRTGGSR